MAGKEGGGLDAASWYDSEHDLSNCTADRGRHWTASLPAFPHVLLRHIEPDSHGRYADARSSG